MEIEGLYEVENWMIFFGESDLIYDVEEIRIYWWMKFLGV